MVGRRGSLEVFLVGSRVQKTKEEKEEIKRQRPRSPRLSSRR